MNSVNERKEEIMSSSIIVDTLSHGPFLLTDDLIAATDELLALDMYPWEIVPDIVLRFAKNVASNEDYFSKYVDAWKESGVNCVSWTVGPLHNKPYSFEGVFHNFSFMTYIFDNRRDFFVKVLKTEDIERAFKEGKKAVILNFQSLQNIGTDIDLLELYYMMGFRVMQLTYNSKNAIGTGCTARRDRGLTEFGLKVINRINELGAIIDVSHCGSQTSMDAVENSKDPIIASHTFSKKVNNHVRGKTDEFLKAVAEKEGYIGVLAVHGFLNDKNKTTINDWLDHIDYIVNLVGVDHVGIGTDFYGTQIPVNLAIKLDEFMDLLGWRLEHKMSFLNKVEGFESYNKFPNFIDGLIKRGYSDQDIKKIAGENFLRVFKKIVG